MFALYLHTMTGKQVKDERSLALRTVLFHGIMKLSKSLVEFLPSCLVIDQFEHFIREFESLYYFLELLTVLPRQVDQIVAFETRIFGGCIDFSPEV